MSVPSWDEYQEVESQTWSKFQKIGADAAKNFENLTPEIISMFGSLRFLLCLNFGIQAVMWTFSSLRKTERFFDLTGSVTLATLAILSYMSNQTRNIRQLVQTCLILLQCARLGSYLFIRICKEGFDRRFNGIRDKPAKFVIHWFLQGIWIFVTLLPSIIVNLTDSSQHVDPNLNKDDYTGWSLWTVGFLIETIADYQKARFRCENANKGKFIHSGLWSLSRHPNYLGEMIMWFALYVPLTNVISGWRLYAFLLCPLFDVFWLVSLSGVPPLEQQGLKRWGDDPLYHKYLRTTSLIIPLIW